MSLNNRIAIRDARGGAVDCQVAFPSSDRSEATTNVILLNTEKRQQHLPKHPLAEADRVVSESHNFILLFISHVLCEADIA